jgi:glycosyltransferase involved in cell wall biosynthesis
VSADEKDKLPDGDPLFSIVVPTFHRPLALARLLASIRQLDFPLDRLEVIVVDDSGTDHLESIVAPFRQSYSILLLRTPHRGPALARQFGVESAHGQYIAFTDDDCLPSPDWLKRLEAGFADDPEFAIGGPVINGLPENPYSSTTQLIYDYVTSQWNRMEVSFLGTSNVSYPAHQFRAAGGFDPTWSLCGGEDRDLCRRWLAAGRRFRFHPEVRIYHYHALNMSTFLGQHFRYGRGASRWYRQSAMPPPGFYQGLLAAGFRGDDHHSGLVTGGLLLLAQAATFCGFLYERLSPGVRGKPTTAKDPFTANSTVQGDRSLPNRRVL